MCTITKSISKRVCSTHWWSYEHLILDLCSDRPWSHTVGVLLADGVHGLMTIVLLFTYLLIMFTPYYSHGCDVKRCLYYYCECSTLSLIYSWYYSTQCYVSCSQWWKCSFSDPTLTTVNVAEAMELMNNWSLLSTATTETQVIPPSRLEHIQSKCFTKRKVASECASYYVHCHPRPSWTHLANHLYYQREFAVVEKLRPFLPLRGMCEIIIIMMVCSSTSKPGECGVMVTQELQTLFIVSRCYS